ncbi:hypothetical protein AB0873_14275 [Micromonospora sp. NPDC047707]|uniref:hypothetical protein n=1 Tax=Micromonospora sp. NPDC047707 TaxID=3154498 RepID=UPI0018AFE0F8|nr:hypothetical protein [Micromonospora sp. WMMC415]
MNIRRWTVGVLAATLFVPGLAACNSGSTEPTSGASPVVPADPKEALLASTKEIEKGNFNFTLTGDGLTGQGLVHKPSNSAQFTVTFDEDSEAAGMSMELIYIQSDSWMKLDLGALAESLPPQMTAQQDKYQHLDRSRIKDSEALAFDLEDVDPAGADVLFKAVTDVQKTGEGAYAGKLDATAATDAEALDADVLKALGDQAKALPFTAKLDTEGRLTELVISVPAAGDTKAHDIKVTYADYGAAKGAQKPPANQVVEAPESTYEMLS